MPRALLAFCADYRAPLLKRRCGENNKQVYCKAPHLFSQSLTAQSFVCSQIKQGQELVPQFRTNDCLVLHALARIRTQTAVSPNYLLGEACYARKRINNRHNLSFRASAWESSVANCGFALIATSQHSLLLAMTSGGNRIQIFHMSFQENVVIVGIRRSEKIFAKLIAWGMCATCVFSLK